MMELIHDWEEKINKLESDWQLWDKERLEMLRIKSHPLNQADMFGDVCRVMEVIQSKKQVYKECLDQVSKLALAMSDL